MVVEVLVAVVDVDVVLGVVASAGAVVDAVVSILC